MSQDLPKSGFLRDKQILTVIPVGRSTLWGWVKLGKFPRPVKLGTRTTAWRVEDVRAWMESRSQGEAA